MSKRIVFILLFVILLVPGLIFVFLRVFGENEFAIPVYHEQGVQEWPEGCLPIIQIPYLVNKNLLDDQSPTLYLAKINDEIESSLARVTEQSGDSIHPVFVQDLDSVNQKSVVCQLVLIEPWNTVLVDTEGRIRGYYELSTREETDRLMMELKILLKQY